jgi:putative transposase
MERRRMQANDLFERGVIPAQIARQVGVSHQIVSDWRRAWRQGGREAFRSAGRAGRRPKLSTEQLAAVAGTDSWRTNQWLRERAVDIAARG